ncbi:CGNR zinc finger domain-containing protein [Streptomyces sp. SAJ15]|uniref:CGNR zinc finger domain-containing protein n=1 Tax=Streptomyces sp. SAJ15 TaxID=2011095 RepID=UPI001185F2DF|nr:CGNR zinc finger domain-containing protein [Streptomyces sp. SAJ15]TVL89687.1 hypothetical protein CD790_25090 [Streptomyces sp. SAJ15]
MPNPGSPSDAAHAPRPLAAVQDFLNSLHVGRGTDELTDPAQAPHWLESIGLRLDRQGAPTRQAMLPAELTTLASLRTALRELVLADEDATDRSHAAVWIEQLAAATRYIVRTDHEGRIRFEPVGTRVERLVGHLLTLVHDAQRDGSWERLKICRNPTCAWVFYDYSRNHSAIWCSMGMCGNRHKVTRHRERKRANAPTTRIQLA